MVQSDGVAYCGDQLIGVTITVAILEGAIVCARFYTRYMHKTAVGSDDYLMIPALLASLGQAALYVYSGFLFAQNTNHGRMKVVKQGGVGYHLAYVMRTPQKLVILQEYVVSWSPWKVEILQSLQGRYANEILDFPFTVSPEKLSILLFYLRIFTLRIFTLRTFRIFAYIVGTVVLSHAIGVLFAAVFHCLPIAYTWDTSITGTCFYQQRFYRWVSPPNIMTEVLLLVMPLPYVWKLQSSLGHKLALTGISLLGSLGLCQAWYMDHFGRRDHNHSSLPTFSLAIIDQEISSKTSHHSTFPKGVASL
ncbi:hypothetical protein N7520_010179 [Penicillium odoratum]|uniref:uncharacterized protein n=1 Tax=Penicillium odoratum TaxID=1167516 RepID=UPI0025483089|nr:uncharacterized protein N7520_010179 [Penicillium odoratum]KAJ5753262.1 hypothetical protein N7520_010179 [Penicillium odoratum]